MDRYFFEMTALGWTYHSRPRYCDDEERYRIDHCYLGSFAVAGATIRLRTLPSVKLFLALYRANIGIHDYEYPSYYLRQNILAVMELMPSTYTRPARQLVMPDPATVRDLPPIHEDLTPSLIGRGLLQPATMEYLNRYRFSDRSLVRLRDRGPLEPNSAYQAHLRLQWSRILSHRAVRAPTDYEATVPVNDFNDDAVNGEGDPDFDPYDLFLDLGGGDY